MINILFININDFVFYTTIIVIVLLVFTIFFLIAKLKKIVDEVEISKLKTFESEETIKFANHRIKNNLQLINSLLKYQAKEYKSKDVDSFLIKGQKRINSIILLHENFKLDSAIESNVDIKKYIEDLFDFFTEVFEIERKSIKFILNTNDICLDIEIALPIGIILNELICNSLLHAFPNQNIENTIQIDLLRIEKNKYYLTYKDNGCGFLYKTTKGLGLKIVDLLSKQINAQYAINNSNGTVVTFVFNT